MARSEDIKTPLARVAYARDLIEARAQEQGKEPKHGVTLIFPKTTDLTALKEAALKAAVEEWGEKAKGWIKDGIIKTPFLDGDGPQGVNKKTGERYPYLVGTTFIRATATTKYPPRIVNKRVLPITKYGDELYSGCYGYAVVNFFTWENDKNGKGVTAGISLFQVAKDGEKLGGEGGPAPDRYFDTIPDDDDALSSGGASGGSAADLFG